MTEQNNEIKKHWNLDIKNWFDTDNTKHILAFNELQTKGSWPIGFIPDGITLTDDWYNIILNKLANCYIMPIVSADIFKDMDILD